MKEKVLIFGLLLVFLEACSDVWATTPCPATNVYCGDKCVSIVENNENCGACDNKCDLENGQACLNGECVCICPSMEYRDGVCVSTSIDAGDYPYDSGPDF